MKFVFSLICLISAVASAETVTTVSELASRLKTISAKETAFDLTASAECIVCYRDMDAFITISDSASSAMISLQGPTLSSIRTGDIVHLKGTISPSAPLYPMAHADTFETIRRGTPPTPIATDVRSVMAGHHDWRFVRITGLVRDVLKSETSSAWACLFLGADNEILWVSVPLLQIPLPDLKKLIGRRVALDGYAHLNTGSFRLFSGRGFHCAGRDAIHPLDTAVRDPFEADELETIVCKTTSQIATSDRVRTRGRVLCTWGRRNFLIKNASGTPTKALVDDGPLPRCDDSIEVSGFPQSGVFNISLVHAQWRPAKPVKTPGQNIMTISAQDVLGDATEEPFVHTFMNGQKIRIRGRVRQRGSETPPANDQLVLEDGDILFTVKCDSDPEMTKRIEPASTVEATGICIIDSEISPSGLAFPVNWRFSVILRDPRDLVLIAAPPWWTPGRLMTVIGLLVTVILGILIRHRTQKRTAALLSRVMTDLKVGERTRLAVELHDSLAQTLTGVSLEIDTAAKLADENRPSMIEHLNTAARTLKSCRDELRNCLWDLRNQALEEADMSTAIRQTLAPHANGVELAIRFNVPRERFSDNMAHAILRIVRELTVNAIRHGKATKIRIAGSIEDNAMKFSVRDNGTGFDVEHAPGFSEGHYGLLGIRERIEAFEGDFALESDIGQGTRATITLNLTNLKG